MAKRIKDGPALQLLQLVWDEQGHQMGHRWERLNSAMYAVTCLAIEYGLRFDVGDFQAIERRFRIGYWGGNDRHMLGEGFYSLACATWKCGGGRCHGPNRSAAIAFEAWKGREPFIARVSPRSPASHRIAIGTKFHWYRDRVTCTSFAEDGLSLTACSYAEYAARSKVLTRKRITHDGITAYHAEIVKQLKAAKEEQHETLAE